MKTMVVVRKEGIEKIMKKMQRKWRRKKKNQALNQVRSKYGLCSSAGNEKQKQKDAVKKRLLSRPERPGSERKLVVRNGRLIKSFLIKQVEKIDPVILDRLL